MINNKVVIIKSSNSLIGVLCLVVKNLGEVLEWLKEKHAVDVDSEINAKLKIIHTWSCLVLIKLNQIRGMLKRLGIEMGLDRPLFLIST